MRLVILWIYVAILRRSISRLFSARFAINNAMRMLTCTGGARPLVARARAPVCPSVATPLEKRTSKQGISIVLVSIEYQRRDAFLAAV